MGPGSKRKRWCPRERSNTGEKKDSSTKEATPKRNDGIEKGVRGYYRHENRKWRRIRKWRVQE
jgi:hypothetical protein